MRAPSCAFKTVGGTRRLRQRTKTKIKWRNLKNV